MAIANIDPIEVASIDFPGAQITWAGGCPFEGGFCFGTEVGELWFSAENFERGKPPILVNDSRQAINGVAFTSGLMAASTPGRVVLHRLGPAGPTGSSSRYEGGAHGIIATPSGGVIAPLGQTGILLVEPDRDGDYSPTVFNPNVELYYYKIASLGATACGENVFACACREGGLGVFINDPRGSEVRFGVHRIRSTSGYTYDIVDVSAIGDDSHPFAVVGLGIDNSLHFSPDIRAVSPTTFRLPRLAGTAYSVFVAGGHVFILTSESLNAYPRLATRSLRGEQLDGSTPVRRLSIEAIDGFLAEQGLLLLVQSERVILLDLAKFADFDTSGLEAGHGHDGPAPFLSEAFERVQTAGEAPLQWTPGYATSSPESAMLCNA